MEFLSKDTIYALAMNQKIFLSVIVIILGMGIIFVARRKKKIDQPAAIEKSSTIQSEVIQLTPNAVSTGQEELTEEVIAVITAAIAASLQTHTSNIVVKNIRRVSQAEPVWAVAGRSEQLGSRF